MASFFNEFKSIIIKNLIREACKELDKKIEEKRFEHRKLEQVKVEPRNLEEDRVKPRNSGVIITPGISDEERKIYCKIASRVSNDYEEERLKKNRKVLFNICISAGTFIIFMIIIFKFLF